MLSVGFRSAERQPPFTPDKRSCYMSTDKFISSLFIIHMLILNIQVALIDVFYTIVPQASCQNIPRPNRW